MPLDYRLKLGPLDFSMFETQQRNVDSGPLLHGFAVSPGSVTAPASVIRSPADFEKMQPDSILVCPTTTPAWTPLFAQARGLVTDVGGILAHGSIVAREYRIPAVMGTGTATQRIAPGELIKLDGDAGTVTLLQRGGSADETPPPAPVRRLRSSKRGAGIALLTGLAVAAAVWLARQRCRAAAGSARC